MVRRIAIVATLDTRWEETKYVKELIERKGHKAVVIDVGSLREPPFPPGQGSRDHNAGSGGPGRR